MQITQTLKRIERLGNQLPHPTLIFIYLCLLILVLSALASHAGLSVIHPLEGHEVGVVNLLSQNGLALILTRSVDNFISFAPIGTTLVAILGIAVAERSGLIGALLKLSVRNAPQSWLTFIVVFSGILSSLAADAGYVVLIPIAALLFQSAGRPPLAGIAAAFAGVSGGYCANLFIGPNDLILAGLSTEAAQIIEAGYQVSPVANYYFMLASTLLIAALGTLITERFIIPFLQNQHPLEPQTTPESNQELNPSERRALAYTALVALIIIILTGLGIGSEQGILRNPEKPGLVQSYFLQGIVVYLFISFVLLGIVYGFSSGQFKKAEDVINSMEQSMSSMATYLVLMFFAAQFVNYFAWSNLGLLIAVQGAELLQGIQAQSWILLLVFIFATAFINLFIGSSSAKWALLGPIFVPMLMLLGISPEASQLAYRLGDSATNIITPLMPYFGIVIAYVRQYDKQAGLGTLAAMMLPYSLGFLLVWSGFFMLWLGLDLPIGPGSPSFFSAPQTTSLIP